MSITDTLYMPMKQTKDGRSIDRSLRTANDRRKTRSIFSYKRILVGMNHQYVGTSIDDSFDYTRFKRDENAFSQCAVSQFEQHRHISLFSFVLRAFRVIIIMRQFSNLALLGIALLLCLITTPR
eukprot:scaffold13179_cov93-Cylindrotheca_fusiformis.AAC.1